MRQPLQLPSIPQPLSTKRGERGARGGRVTSVGWALLLEKFIILMVKFIGGNAHPTNIWSLVIGH